MRYFLSFCLGGTCVLLGAGLFLADLNWWEKLGWLFWLLTTDFPRLPW